MTTDFLENEIIYKARTIKMQQEFNKSTVIEKFEIERVYWEEQGVDWTGVSFYRHALANKLIK